MWVSYCLNHRGYPIMPEAYSNGTLLVEPYTGIIRPRNVIRRERPANGTRFRAGSLYYVSYTHGNRYYCREVRAFRDGFRYVPDTEWLYFTNPDLFIGVNSSSLEYIMRSSYTLATVQAREVVSMFEGVISQVNQATFSATLRGRTSRFSAKVWPPTSKRTRYQNMREEIV
jgi:hypothetical protein